ncbi:MAG: hypothetical protein H7067_13335, partial [Burkholderiales bacterium]|nr:hypothetical protein [Opitutaceae bacterium]
MKNSSRPFASVAPRRLLSCPALAALAVYVAALPLVPAALAVDSSAISSFVTGAFNWSNTANWTGGTIAEGTGAVATFSNNYTGTVQINFGLGGGDTNLTLGTLNFTDTVPDRQVTLQ